MPDRVATTSVTGIARSTHHHPAVAIAADDCFVWPNVVELTTALATKQSSARAWLRD
jgi:hypothetical protein